MKTTKKEFKEQVQQHILECLSTDETTNQKEQLERVIKEFMNWYSPYEKKRTPNRQQAFSEFLMCLPSCLSVEYEHHNIYHTLKSWYENCGATYKEQDTTKESQLYHNLIYREFNTLIKKNGLEFPY